MIKLRKDSVYLFMDKPILVREVLYDMYQKPYYICYQHINKDGKPYWWCSTKELKSIKHYPEPYMIVKSAFKHESATLVLL